MNACRGTREELRRRFDEGLGLVHGLPAHARQCPKCRGYAERLRSLEAALHALPLEDGSLAPDADAVMDRVRRAPGPRSWGLLVLACACATVLVGALGWLFPLPLAPRAWIADLSFGIPRFSVHAAWQGLQDALRGAVAEGLEAVRGSMPVMPRWLWMATGTLAALLILVNSIEALWLRGGGAGVYIGSRHTKH